MYRHDIRVRYGDCDMQKVVFNAHYLAYCDDAAMCWFSARLGERMHEFDCMLKSVKVVWHRPLRLGDVASLECSVTRWGNSSFDVTIRGHVAGESSFEATIVYVSTTPGAPNVVPVPGWVRAAFADDETLSA
ncbi:MAG: acyl-CoA thioesterase [Ilumatobacteraceae bacterium]|jgi:acyl-CoA thioester hydrolase